VSFDKACWYPVASASDMPPHHVYQTRLNGHPLAIWRDASDRINIWEDRCPHRSARFSIGVAIGDELRCQYHGWRFASGSGACTSIPAQPRTKPAAAIRATVWPVREQGGLVWTGVAPEGSPPGMPDGAVLRAIAVQRAAAAVEAALPAVEGATFFVQPIDDNRSVIRGVAHSGELPAIDATLEQLRRRLEDA
jgi:phenylpropionate dioxygenase-like ring-hydroxylating dioxygenase large terminal subunit